MKIEIITPDRVVLKGEMDWVVVPGSEGDFQVLPGHAPMVTGLRIGRVVLRKGIKESTYATSGGFCEVLPDTVSLLVTAAEAAKDIDLERAQTAMRRAHKRLEEKDEKTDPVRAKQALNRALNRIRIAQKGRMVSS